VRRCFIQAQSERDKTVCVSSQTTKKGRWNQKRTRGLKRYFRKGKCDIGLVGLTGS
jgi:hypothetical protein